MLIVHFIKTVTKTLHHRNIDLLHDTDIQVDVSEILIYLRSICVSVKFLCIVMKVVAYCCVHTQSLFITLPSTNVVFIWTIHLSVVSETGKCLRRESTPLTELNMALGEC